MDTMTTNGLLQEQLMLHFGDTYRNVVSQAVRFCKTLINKPWWGSNRTVLLNNEGGMSGMRQSALCSIIEKEDIELGLKAYGSYLRAEYASDNILPSIDDTLIALEIELSSTIESQSSDTLGSVPTGPPEEAESVRDSQSQYGLLQKVQLTGLEQQFFETYASVKDVKETCALLALDVATGFRIWKRVHARAVYHTS